MVTVITIRPDRIAAPGPPTALPVEEGEPLQQLPIHRTRDDELASPVALRKKTVHRYLTDEPEERRRLIKRGTKGWFIGPVSTDWLRMTSPDRIKSTSVDPRVLSTQSLHPD